MSLSSLDPEATTIADLQRAVAELTFRVSDLERELAEVRNEPAPVSDEVVLAISAAVAAYLGKRATVRRIKLANNPAWVQQGRAATQMTRAWVRHR